MVNFVDAIAGGLLGFGGDPTAIPRLRLARQELDQRKALTLAQLQQQREFFKRERKDRAFAYADQERRTAEFWQGLGRLLQDQRQSEQTAALEAQQQTTANAIEAGLPPSAALSMMSSAALNEMLLSGGAGGADPLAEAAEFAVYGPTRQQAQGPFAEGLPEGARFLPAALGGAALGGSALLNSIATSAAGGFGPPASAAAMSEIEALMRMSRFLRGAGALGLGFTGALGTAEALSQPYPASVVDEQLRRYGELRYGPSGRVLEK